MDGGASFYWLLAATAVGTGVQVDAGLQSSYRQEQLDKEEQKAQELIALDQENERLRDLRSANDEIGVRAGGIDAFASPSLIAARQFNFKMVNEDIQNIRLNLQARRSGLHTRIGILGSNRTALKGGGFLALVNSFAAGIDTGKTVFGGGKD